MRFNLNNLRFEDTDVLPDKPALVTLTETISWKNFKQRVEEMGEVLHSLKLPKNYPVIIYGHKEPDFVVSMVACMVNNLTYIPVDTVFPPSRVNEIAQEISSSVVINLTQHSFSNDLPIEIKKNVIVEKNQFDNRSVLSVNHRFIYIIFTSGSTGKPKGVQIHHNNLKSFIQWIERDFGFTANDVFMNQIPFSFDLSIYELMSFLHFGATLLLCDAEMVKQADTFYDFLHCNHCSIWVSTPSFIYIHLTHPKFNGNTIPSLKQVFLSGEPMPHRTASLVKKNFDAVKLINSYGPTEATNTTTYIEITQEILNQHQLLPVGYPKFDSELLIDKQNPDDERGEVIIKGPHVSQGYINRPDLNETKFFEKDGVRCYRTGDLGFYKDGILFVSGRNDDQVKLNGYRIELNDINVRLKQIDGIDEAVTIALKQNDVVKKLISFIHCKNATTEEIKAIIHQRLPHYMLPSQIIQVTDFPVNNNGKIDKKKLEENFLNGVYKA